MHLLPSFFDNPKKVFRTPQVQSKMPQFWWVNGYPIIAWNAPPSSSDHQDYHRACLVGHPYLPACSAVTESIKGGISQGISPKVSVKFVKFSSKFIQIKGMRREYNEANRIASQSDLTANFGQNIGRRIQWFLELLGLVC